MTPPPLPVWVGSGMAVLVDIGVAVLIGSGVLVSVGVGVMASTIGVGVYVGGIDVGGVGVATDSHALTKVIGMIRRIVLKKSLLMGFLLDIA